MVLLIINFIIIIKFITLIQNGTVTNSPTWNSGGPNEKWGLPKKKFPALRAGICAPPLIICFLRAPLLHEIFYNIVHLCTQISREGSSSEAIDESWRIWWAGKDAHVSKIRPNFSWKSSQIKHPQQAKMIKKIESRID